MSDDDRPPKPDEILLAEAEGRPVFFDEDSGQWYVGDDPGFDPDADDDTPDGQS